MPKLTFSDCQKTVDARSGSSILDVALDFNVPLEHSCGGNAACTTCAVFVEKGGESLSPMSPDERELLDGSGKLQAGVRLGCQARLQNEDIVAKPFE